MFPSLGKLEVDIEGFSKRLRPNRTEPGAGTGAGAGPTTHPEAAGSISMFMGPMFSGKTTQLLLSANLNHRCGRRTVILLPDNSVRQDDLVMDKDGNPHLRSRDGVAAQCATILVPTDNLFSECKRILNQYDVICIDEAQFFSNLVYTCRWLRHVGKTVYVSGLELTFKREPFEAISNLGCYADNKTLTTAVCEDCSRNNATLTYRTTASTALVEVGGSEAYIPLCQTCFDKRTGWKP